MSGSASYLPSAVVLGALFLGSAVLTAARPNLRPEVTGTSRLIVVGGSAILVQLLHFVEELRFGFATRFPDVFGLEPLAESAFVWFNVAWLVTWIASLAAVRRGVVVATCPLWFLGLASVLNLVAHPIVALRVNGYFPGLLTAPLSGALGIILIRELIRATSP